VRVARIRALTLLGVAFAVLAAACSPSPSEEPMNPAWPTDIRQAPFVVREAYAFADEHPEVLAGVPCYCGCGVIGHTSNLACYVADDATAGAAYDLHALGCSICVDITLDAKRLLDDGQSVDEIRAHIDATYSRYGPSNMP
jgi:Protein of unknown function with PCYCGC motif